MMTSQLGAGGFLRARMPGAGSNRAERLLGLGSGYSFASADADGDNSEELREEDIWPEGGTDEDLGDENKKKKNYFHFQPSAIQQSSTKIGAMRLSEGLGLSVAFADQATRSRGLSFISSSRMILQIRTSDAPNESVHYQSAPVNVPDWTKILGGPRKDSTSIFPTDDDDVEEEERLPPHEYLARKDARSHVDATSVLEGVGRKLKGRDLSRVRNAVWTQTGFLG